MAPTDGSERIRSAVAPVRQALWPRVRERIAIDTRSLAVFRVLAGLLLIVDVVLRSRNFQFFYTDQGAVPVGLAVAHAPDGAFSLYYLSGSPAWTGTLFALQAVAGVLLVFGWRTRTATVAAFVLAASLDYRNVFVTSYADTLFRVLLFYAMFLPLGERWSVDALRRERASRPRVVSLASGLILVQMVVMYLVTGFQKHQSDLWVTGEALPVVMAHDSITFLLGDVLVAAPGLLQFGGLVWLYLLSVSFLFVVFVGRARDALAATFVGVHLALAVTVRIGQFSYVAIAGLVLFFQGAFWRDAGDWLRANGVPVDWYADRMGTAGRRVEHLLPRFPSPGTERVSVPIVRVVSVLAVLILVVTGANMVVGALATAGGIDDPEVRDPVDDAMERFGVEQPGWTIFAPNPSTTDEWFVVAVETTDGTRWDLHNERPLRVERPGKHLEQQWDTYRERFYWANLADRDVALAYHEYLCRGENPTLPDIAYVTVYEIEETIDPDRPATLDDPSRRLVEINRLFTGACGEREPVAVAPDEDPRWR